MTDLETIEPAYKDATEITLWEAKSNHEVVTYYEGLLKEYTRDFLIMREDFLEEITGKHIENKAFEED